jgi:hypothetical protein
MSEGPQKDPAEPFRLQQFGIKDSAYERPNQEWVCGHLSEGNPCSIGPDSHGRCLATTECHPLKKGDRWFCTRRDAAGAPSPCSSGPLPEGQCTRVIATCAPVRSTRAKRGRFVFGVFALTVGVLGFFLFGPDRADFIVPGQLTDAHAQVLKAHRAEDCAACHLAGSGDASQWLRVAFAPPVGAVQNDKCLTCHLPALGHDAGMPHSLPPARLQQVEASLPKSPKRTPMEILASFSPSVQVTSTGQLACSTCHQEHAGRLHNLTQMSDVSCQVCHKVQFESFAHGHPEFKAVPRERAGIIFDHAAHEPRMPGGLLECAQCHRPDPEKRTMQFTGFEAACVGCHAQGQIDHHGDQIRNDVRVIFQLPATTPDDPAAWPKQALAPGNSLTPMMHFLIAGDADPRAVSALKLLDSDVQAAGSLDDWEADAPVKAQLLTAIKRVLTELSPDASPATQPSNVDRLRARIARAAGLPAQNWDVTTFLEEISAASGQIQAWQQHCMPDLGHGSVNTTGPATAPAGSAAAAAANWKPPKSDSQWYINADTMSVDFRPTHANLFETSWIDMLASGAVPGSSPKIEKKMSDTAFLIALRGKLLTEVGGSCVKCHAIQPAPDSMGGSFLVNWNAAGHTTRAAGYVKFDHRPHLTLFADNRNCAACHQVETGTAAPAAKISEASLEFSIGKPNHGMAPHTKAQCTACHSPNGAPDACLTCHVYHMKK